MAMIKCSECGKDISDKAALCIGCGAPLSPTITTEPVAEPDITPVQKSPVIGDLNGDGKVDWEDFKIALSRSKQYAADKVNDAVTMAQGKLKSAKEKDAAAVEDFSKSLENEIKIEKQESQINRDKFKSALKSTIDIRFAEIIASKKESDTYLTYVDAQILTTRVRGIFNNALKVIPPQIEAACLLSEAVLAPSTKDKENKIKAAFGIAGGTTGIGMVIAAIGYALTWTPGIVTVVTTLIAGGSTVMPLAGPIGLGVAGVSLAVIAGYFASTSNNQTDTERFMRVLKDSTARAVDAIWIQYETELSRTVALADDNGEKP